MKLKAPFIQLPFCFDVDRLSAEISRFDTSCWRDHPQKFPGNYMLPLVSLNGDPCNEGFAGSMLPTPYLERSPYLMQVLEKLGAVWGRCRLMKLTGYAEVSSHVDVNYYWHDRVRVHVPIITTPDVRFLCGEDEVNMKAGECWIFDTWRVHRVMNEANSERIHLVADTVGSVQFWDSVERGKVHGALGNEDWQPEFYSPPEPMRPPVLALESSNIPDVMTPWELREYLNFLFDETQSGPELAAARDHADRFIMSWQESWTQYGSDQSAWPIYRQKLDAFEAVMRGTAQSLVLVNSMNFLMALSGLTVIMLGDRRHAWLQQQARRAS